MVLIAIAILIAGLLISLAISSIKEPLNKLSDDIEWLKKYVEKRSTNKWDDKFYVQQ